MKIYILIRQDCDPHSVGNDSDVQVLSASIIREHAELELINAAKEFVNTVYDPSDPEDAKTAKRLLAFEQHPDRWQDADTECPTILRIIECDLSGCNISKPAPVTDPRIAVAEQISNMIDNNILCGNGWEPFEGWCENGAVFDCNYETMTDEQKKSCVTLMHQVKDNVDSATALLAPDLDL